MRIADLEPLSGPGASRPAGPPGLHDAPVVSEGPIVKTPQARHEPLHGAPSERTILVRSPL